MACAASEPAIPLERAERAHLSDHLAEMRRQREQTLAVIARMRPEDFERRASNAIFGSLTAMQWLRSYYRHDRMHYDQVQRRGADVQAEASQSGGEPDQRRAARTQ